MVVIELMRPHQWSKNAFVFAAIIFSRNLFRVPKLLQTLEAFAAFCFLASGIYAINDILDIEKDRQHPTKSKRPLPSGRISKLGALTVGLVCIAIAMAISVRLGADYLQVVSAYLILNLAYSVSLKHLVIVDVLVISLGFVLRVYAGAEAIGVGVSPWLMTCTIFLSLFLAFTKRRHELVLLEERATGHRRILAEYSPQFLDQMVSVVTASAVMSYVLYTFSDRTAAIFGTDRLKLTIPLVLYGIFRYLYLVYHKEKGGSPSREILEDVPFLINLALWFLVVVWVIFRAEFLRLVGWGE